MVAPPADLDWSLPLQVVHYYKARVIKVHEYNPLGAEVILDCWITPLERRYEAGERSPMLFVEMLTLELGLGIDVDKRQW